MTTRRTFIRTVAAAMPAALAMPGIANAQAHRGIAQRATRAVIVDDMHPSTRAFGARVGMRGTPVFATRQGDITALWLEHLRPLWTSSQAPIAGLTLPGTLFCLEQLAWQHRMRVTFHAEHVVLPDAGLEHTVHRDAQSRRLTAGALVRAGGRWPQHLADSLLNHRPGGARRGPSLAGLQPGLPEGALLLTSWIIA